MYIPHEKENKFNAWKLRNENRNAVEPKRMLRADFTADVNRFPLAAGKVHFIREVDSRGEISVLNDYFDVGKEYIGEYVWTTIETLKQTLRVYYKDKKLKGWRLRNLAMSSRRTYTNAMILSLGWAEGSMHGTKNQNIRVSMH